MRHNKKQCYGAWDEHVKRVLQNGRQKIGQVHSNRDIDLTARRLLLISVVRPTLEYGGEVWEGNKAQAAALESVMTGGAKRILGCSSSNEAVRGDMGFDSLQGQRDKAKLLLCRSIGIQGSFLCRSGMSSHVEVGKGSIGVRLSTICFLYWAFIRQSG